MWSPKAAALPRRQGRRWRRGAAHALRPPRPAPTEAPRPGCPAPAPRQRQPSAGRRAKAGAQPRRRLRAAAVSRNASPAHLRRDAPLRCGAVLAYLAAHPRAWQLPLVQGAPGAGVPGRHWPRHHPGVGWVQRRPRQGSSAAVRPGCRSCLQAPARRPAAPGPEERAQARHAGPSGRRRASPCQVGHPVVARRRRTRARPACGCAVGTHRQVRGSCRGMALLELYMPCFCSGVHP
mmetsp:Transcript_90567/g.270220  ORF Transcript_90567/g.270220 Transcript_90567/m.270220 type:complete len:235 (-) Transcript_90567:106-810(-)